LGIAEEYIDNSIKENRQTRPSFVKQNLGGQEGDFFIDKNKSP